MPHLYHSDSPTAQWQAVASSGSPRTTIDTSDMLCVNTLHSLAHEYHSQALSIYSIHQIGVSVQVLHQIWLLINSNLITPMWRCVLYATHTYIPAQWLVSLWSVWCSQTLAQMSHWLCLCALAQDRGKSGTDSGGSAPNDHETRVCT